MRRTPELPSRSDYRKALETITDHRWNFIKAFTGSDTDSEPDKQMKMQPHYILPEEKIIFLLPLSYILPKTWIPGWVRQWAGPDGEAKFIKEAGKLMKTHTP